MATAKKSVKTPKPEAAEEIVKEKVEAVQPEPKKDDSNDIVTVELFYDGEKYKDPLYVSVGNHWRGMLQRGVPVRVPRYVYEGIMDMERQQRSARETIKLLSDKDLEILNG